jgi:thiosulfate dehydrogenase [quinone] large subunit
VTRPSLQTLALLPVRFFFGATFLWAGLDKLIDPAFLDPTGSTSLHAQLVAFERFSPLGGLIGAALPFASIIGLLIAVAEIGIGIGVLSGLAFRVAAVGGALLSLLFWLTASWATHPYYYGADLPYMIGWIALAIAGHADYLVPARFSEAGQPVRVDHLRGTTPEAMTRAQRRARRRAFVEAPESPQSPERRLFLQTATLAALAAIVASFTIPLRSAGVVADRIGAGASRAPVPTPGSSVPSGGIAVATVAAVTSAGSATFTVPFNAPSPLPAGDPGVIVQLTNGTFVAFDAVCTHAGCTVEWDQADRVLVCPCHEAVFDAEHGAAVVQGPAPTPLTSLPLVIDAATGTILLVPQPG